MNKSGFTLTEVLVALGIVGIVAAITVPALENLLPDKDKIEVLKTYKVIRDINEEIKNNKQVWSDSANNVRWAHITSQDYAFQFIESMELASPFDRTGATSPYVFNTIDGKQWTINTPAAMNGALITVDFEPDNNNGCIFRGDRCPNPTKFMFEVNSINLQVGGRDALTIEYLANPNKLNDKKRDYAEAKKMP